MIESERLILRPWRDEDLAPYAVMNADPLVREFFAGLLTREESDAEVRRYQQRYEREGFCMFAAKLAADGTLAGIIGMQTMSFAVPSLPQPAVEIGWRIASPYWGRGLATEGARAALHHAFASVGLKQVVAIAAAANARSRRVMEKLGMTHQPALNFLHPALPEDHFARLHVLYSVDAPAIR